VHATVMRAIAVITNSSFKTTASKNIEVLSRST
jgi:hypothetical protein